MIPKRTQVGEAMVSPGWEFPLLLSKQFSSRYSWPWWPHKTHKNRLSINETQLSFSFTYNSFLVHNDSWKAWKLQACTNGWTKPDRTCFFEFEAHKSANESASFIIFAYFCSKNCRYNRLGHFVCDYTGKRGSTQAVYHLTHTHTHSEVCKWSAEASFHCRMSKAPVGRRFGVRGSVCCGLFVYFGRALAFPRREEIKSAKQMRKSFRVLIDWN